MSLDNNIWQRLINGENEYEESKWYFFKHCSDVFNTLRKALHIPNERGTALRLIKYLNIEDHKALLYDLIEEASIGHSDIQLVRNVILHLSTEWLRENIEAPIEKVLSNGGEEEYRRLIELCISIDNNLVRKLSNLALMSIDTDVKEVGKEFQAYLDGPKELQDATINLLELLNSGVKPDVLRKGFKSLEIEI